MKRLLCFFLMLLMLWGGTLPPSLAEDGLTDVYCSQQGFSTKIPADKTASWEEGTGLRISVGRPGYVPYVAVFRRPTKLNSPVNYLNNVYREYMENKYNNNVGTNPCREYEIGGKTLYLAQYHYEARGNKLCLALLVEVREDGDVEYHAKFVEGQGKEAFAVLETAVRYYSTEDAPDGIAQNSVLSPADISGLSPDTANGTYWTRIADTERILNSGYFTASLYVQDRYDAAGVEALQPGDAVQISGQIYTVASLRRHNEGSLEIIPSEPFDGYIVFRKDEGGYTALVNDWTPVSFLTDYRVMMPLPYDFSFGWLDGGLNATVYDADAFISLLTQNANPPALSQYNTMITFQNDLVMSILHADAPLGPVE